MVDALTKAVARVVDNDNCTGCGGCALVSDRITMQMSEAGWMRPVVGPIGDEPARQERDRFSAMCPGVRLIAPVPETALTHPTFGRFVSAWRGRALSDEVRSSGSSAGVLTAMSTFLVETGRVNSVSAAAESTSAPTRTVPVRITSRDEALKASGSRYAPVSALEGARNAEAVVAKPCEISALRRLDPTSNPIALSFFCAGTPSQRATETLIDNLGVDPSEVISLRYRGNGWPGEFTVSDGRKKASISYDESWGKHLGRDLQWRCKLCPDGTGEDADIAVGDFWRADERGYPLFDDAEGDSVVIARTRRGHDLLLEAAAAGAIAIEPVDLDDVARIQPLQRNRKRTIAVRQLARLVTFKRVPRYTGYRSWVNAVQHPRESARTFAGTVTRSWRDRLKGRRT